MIAAIVMALIAAGAALGGAYLGHLFTLKGISHVQPAVPKVRFSVEGGVTEEPDPWDEIPKPPTDEEKEALLADELKKMGIDPKIVKPSRFFNGPDAEKARFAGVGAEDE